MSATPLKCFRIFIIIKYNNYFFSVFVLLYNVDLSIMKIKPYLHYFCFCF